MTLKLILVTATGLLLSSVSFDARLVIDHNLNSEADPSFRFKHIPSPAKDDLGAKAKLTLIDGEADPAGADLSALTDGRLPGDEDEPGANFFFNAGSSGGRFSMDFGEPMQIVQVNSYSWHPNTRGPQLYKLYGADGSAKGFNPFPKRGIDPAREGWRFIATVSTLPDQGEEGGQYGVSITDSSGTLGKFRYLLFDCYVTELDDNFGNTFYSEVDVIRR